MSKFIYLIGAIVLMFFSACNRNKTTNEHAAEIEENAVNLTIAEMQNSKLEFGKIAESSFQEEINLTGKTEVPPQNLHSVSLSYGGKLVSTPLLPGAVVTRGAIIAVLEDPEFLEIQKAYLLAKNNLYFTEKEYNRQKSLQQNSASSDKSFMQAQTEHQMALINYKSLIEKLHLININENKLTENNLSAKISIYSPISGTVTRFTHNLGKYIASHESLVEIADNSDLHLTLNVFEKDIKKIKSGALVEAKINSDNQTKYLGKIVLTGKEIQENGSVEVHCHFNGNTTNLFSNMFMQALVFCDSIKVFSIVQDAVLRYGGNSYLCVQENGTMFKFYPVELGRKSSNEIEIVNANDLLNKKIVTKGAYGLLMKWKNSSEE